MNLEDFLPNAEDFRPDKDALDDEWVKQPELYHKYATYLADARNSLEEAKNKVEVVKAELDKDIRENPEEYEMVKLTEDAIKAAIAGAKRYRRAVIRVNSEKHRVDILAAAVTALDHKKKALENLVYLHGQSYFSSPQAKSEDREVMEEVTKKSKSKKRNPNLTRRNLQEEGED